MKTVSFPLVVAGALIGVAMVMIFRTENPGLKVETPVVRDGKLEEVARRSVGELMGAFQAAPSASERVEIAKEFRGLRSGEFEEALERSGYRDESWRLPEAAKCLLIAWAEKDAREALAWSWENLKTSGKWEEAFKQVIETWVANDPAAVVAFFHETQRLEGKLTVEEGEESVAIILDRETVEMVRKAFFATDSAIALMAHQGGVGAPTGRFPRGLDFSDLLNSVEEVEAAQRDWRDVEGADLARASLANRLAELTPWEPVAERKTQAERKPGYQGIQLPADFNGGPVSQRWNRQQLAWKGAQIDFQRTVREAQTLEDGEREAVFLAIYDSWYSAHPGEEPDLDLLPEDAQKLWQDLDGLGPINDSFSSNSWQSEEFLKK